MSTQKLRRIIRNTALVSIISLSGLSLSTIAQAGGCYWWQTTCKIKARASLTLHWRVCNPALETKKWCNNVPSTDPYQDIPNWFAESHNAVDLAKNMVRAGFRAHPSKWVAHHIVAHTDPRAERSRDILNQVNTDYDNWSNGVYLPHRTTVKGVCYHPSVHTDIYYEQVDKLLEQALPGNATDKEHRIKSALRTIATKLRNGSFKTRELKNKTLIKCKDKL